MLIIWWGNVNVNVLLSLRNSLKMFIIKVDGVYLVSSLLFSKGFETHDQCGRAMHLKLKNVHGGVRSHTGPIYGIVEEEDET